MVVSDELVAVDLGGLDPAAAVGFSTRVLGNGIFREITDVVYVKTENFTAADTPRIAMEVDRLNQGLREAKRPYILAGPGRWGSSDPWLGIPVHWGQINGAKVIVEVSLAPAQRRSVGGSHFFQNITSLRIGVLHRAHESGGRPHRLGLAQRPAGRAGNRAPAACPGGPAARGAHRRPDRARSDFQDGAARGVTAREGGTRMTDSKPDPTPDVRPEPRPEAKPEWRVIVDLLRETNPILLNRISRKMMNYLFKRNIKDVAGFIERLRAEGEKVYAAMGFNPNEPAPRYDRNVFEQFADEIFRIANNELLDEEIGRMLRLWLRHEQARFLTLAAGKRDVQLGEVTDAVHRFSLMPDAQRSLSPEENQGLRVALIRRFYSENLDYINTTKKHVDVADFADILSRTIGPASGVGNGRAAGLFRAEAILEAVKQQNVLLRNVSTPKTWYVTSDGHHGFSQLQRPGGDAQHQVPRSLRDPAGAFLPGTDLQELRPVARNHRRISSGAGRLRGASSWCVHRVCWRTAPAPRSPGSTRACSSPTRAPRRTASRP